MLQFNKWSKFILSLFSSIQKMHKSRWDSNEMGKFCLTICVRFHLYFFFSFFFISVGVKLDVTVVCGGTCDCPYLWGTCVAGKPDATVYVCHLPVSSTAIGYDHKFH